MELDFDSGFDLQETEEDGSISPADSQTSVVEVESYLISKLRQVDLDMERKDQSLNLIDFDCDFSSLGFPNGREGNFSPNMRQCISDAEPAF
jgi:hypothetical protein